VTNRLAIAAFAALTLSSTLAVAQWTLPEGQMFLSTGFDGQYARGEFFGFDGDPSEERNFPLRGEYLGATMTFDARVGLTDELELELMVPLRVVTYTSDPVILIPQPMGSMESAFDYYQQNLIELSQGTMGLADIEVAGRYRFLAQPFLLTGELRLKVPGGYDGPSGTFGSNPTDTQDFMDNVGTYVSPENISDDVTLGDGQVDLIGRLLFGAAFDTGTFFAGDAGYNVRFDDAGHQFLASLRVGQLIENVVLLFAGASLAMSVTEGRVIGVSVAAQDPNVPAAEFGGLTNILLREVRLQRDYLNVYGGVIFRISPSVEIKLAYARTAWGRNVAAVNTFTIGVGARTTLFGGADAPEEDDEDEYEDEEEEYEDEYDDGAAEEAPVEQAYPETQGDEATE